MTSPRPQEIGLTDDGIDTAGYSLELFSDQLFSSPIEPNALVPVTHTIYVRASVHIGESARPANRHDDVTRGSARLLAIP